jgi:serine/threonine-protein kinase HipA
MMTFKIEQPTKAFVWIWLPGETEPVVAGQVVAEGQDLIFNYGQSYLKRPHAIAIHKDELPLKPGRLPLLEGLSIPGCIRDGMPDAWGRRVILNSLHGLQGPDIDTGQVDELTYMLLSGSDRIGALDFQSSSTRYEPRNPTNSTLEELQEAADRVERGLPLTPDLDRALHHGTSVGGARPKSLIEDGERKYLAKFSASTDLYSIVKYEFVAMRLAAKAGLHVAPVRLERSAQKDVLLVERFDRVKTEGGWLRRPLISALTLLRLDEMMGRYASYEDLTDIIRAEFDDAQRTLRELFGRLVFNVLCGNTDDHARNHAALWDGFKLQLSPAYDICPQPRSGREASQAMLITDNDRRSRINSCLHAAPAFHLNRNEARAIITHQMQMISAHWDDTCDLAGMGEVDRKFLWGRQFLNPFAFEELSGEDHNLAQLADEVIRTRG